MADLAASRAKIPSTPGDRDEEEIEEHDEYEEDEDEVAEEVEEEEEAYVSEDEEKSAVSDAKPYVPPSNEALSAAEKKMKYFMDRMSVCNMRNKGHPRNREGIFFMPQTFAEDIFYDPFQSHYYPGNLLVPLEEMEELIVQGGSSRYVVNDLPKSSNIPTVRGQDINSDESVEIAYRRSIGRGPIRIHLRKVTDLSYGYTEQNYVEAKTEPEVYYDIQQDIDEMAPEEKDPFTDITQSVKDHKSKLEAQRMAELYQTSLDDIASYDYIRIFRQFQKDWYKFFKQERDSQIKYDSDDEDFLYEPDALIASNTGSGLEHSVVGGNSSVTSTGLEIPQSLLDVVDENTVKITPLPFGKVLKKQIIKRKVYQYYQIELLDQSSILTIELNCLKGTADMYVSHEKLPSIIKYEYHVSCNKENDKIGRLTFAPKCSGTFLVAIYSANTGAKYNLWAYGSTDLPEDIPQLLGVTKIINKFNNLLQSNEKQLGIHFPRLEKEATMKSEQQIQHKKEVRDTIRSVIMEMKKIEEEFGTQNLETILHSGEDDEEVLDRENVESFVVKVGRFAMRKERELKEKMKVTQNIDIKTIYDIDDPNYHEDLFSRPKLPNRRAELSLVDKLDDQNESSTIIEPMTNKKSDSFVADGIYMDDTVKPSLLDRNNKSYHNVTAFFSNALGVQSDESHYPNKGLKLPAINSKSYNSSSYDNQNNDSIPNKQSTENASNLRSKTLFVSKSQTEMELDRKTTKSVPKVSKLKRNDVLLKKIPSTISYKLTK